jgi:hypothetical protein
MASTEYDFIICGGGIGGCVVASRLHERLPDAKILLVEAGPNVHENPLVTQIQNALTVPGSALDWSYDSVPQKHLNNRVTNSTAGKALGGGSAINYCELGVVDEENREKADFGEKLAGFAAIRMIIMPGVSWLAIPDGAMRVCCRTFARRRPIIPRMWT